VSVADKSMASWIGASSVPGEDIGQRPHDMEQTRDAICLHRACFLAERARKPLRLLLECELPLDQ
jgi:hypothetical protein